MQPGDSRLPVHSRQPRAGVAGHQTDSAAAVSEDDIEVARHQPVESDGDRVDVDGRDSGVATLLRRPGQHVPGRGRGGRSIRQSNVAQTRSPAADIDAETITGGTADESRLPAPGPADERVQAGASTARRLRGVQASRH